jgi:hypothetical protein
MLGFAVTAFYLRDSRTTETIRNRSSRKIQCVLGVLAGFKAQ